jgi:hypothetical protein
MGPCDVPLTETAPLFDSEASNVPWKLETEKTGTVNCIVEITALPRIYKKAVLSFCNFQ